MKYAGLFAVAMICAVPLCAAPAPATAPAAIDPGSAATARQAVEEGVRRSLAILRDPNLSRAEKSQRIGQIADDAIDFETVSRLALGPPWKQLTDAQKEEFVREFRKHVVAICAHAPDGYRDQDVEVTSEKQEERGDFTVHTRILSKQDDGSRKETGQVDFRLRRRDGRWRIIDLNLEGISIAANLRAQFQAIISNGGIGRMFEVLRQRDQAHENADRAADNARTGK
jgi:phospholipid transport system substrate-binding protein